MSAPVMIAASRSMTYVRVGSRVLIVDGWAEPDLWAAVASELRDYRTAGLGHVLTEDTLRFATIRAAAAAGSEPTGMRVELPHPTIAGARVDLAVGQPPGTLVEFKYPREPRDTNAAWTMTLGEVLKDFYRLSAYPGRVTRVFAYAESRRLRRYMLGAAEKYGIDIDRLTFTIAPATVAALPNTARDIIGPASATPITAKRLTVVEVDEDLRLSVYLVEGPPGHITAEAAALSSPEVGEASSEGPAAERRPDARAGARQEILDAIDAVLVRNGANSVAVEDVLFEMRRRQTRYADSTIRTMMTSHMCANAPDHAAVTYKDLERVGRGLYRRL
jgi:hypothetical protein